MSTLRFCDSGRSRRSSHLVLQSAAGFKPVHFASPSSINLTMLDWKAILPIACALRLPLRESREKSRERLRNLRLESIALLIAFGSPYHSRPNPGAYSTRTPSAHADLKSVQSVCKNLYKNEYVSARALKQRRNLQIRAIYQGKLREI